jgi:cellulose synthase/poly-beta-1,6-N-acetylglucosamine synthase-like glycosyltransferase
VSDSLPSVTIIIPARPDQTEIKAVVAARQLDYPSDRLEITVARGKQPSVQRNTAIKAAHGELIYFLDDDSVPPPGNLRAAAKHFADPAVKMVGGPNLCPPDAPLLEQVFALVLSSWAFGPSRARYTPVGQARPASEKELILCNLMARRADLLELGGFNEALYPNEENALMDELHKRGGKLIYDPQWIVHRRPRRSLKAFIKMLMTYGRGRAEQFRLHPTFGSALNFVPPLFCLYLVALLILALVPLNHTLTPLKLWAAAPLALYALLVLLLALASIPSGGVLRSLLATPLLAVTNIFYGIGIWRGLFTRLKSPAQSSPPPVTLETVAL